MTIETPEQITAAEIISKIKPFDRIDADLVIVLRDRLISSTGCSWETARQCILTELNKRACVKIPPEYADKNRSSDPGGRPKSNHPYPPNTIAVRGTPEEVAFVRRVIPDNRQRLTILLDWVEGR